MKNPTFEVLPKPQELPAALVALDPGTIVIARKHWFDIALVFNIAELREEIEKRIHDQAAGLFAIDEAACIAADAVGADRKQIRQLIWKAVDDGALVPLHDKAKAPLPLPLAGTNKNLALVRAHELESLFAAWPTVAGKPATSPKKPADNTLKKNKRRDDLWVPIEGIQKAVADPSDTAAIWLRLCQLAQAGIGQEKEKFPLVGMAGKSIQWRIDKNDELKEFTKKMLGERLRKQNTPNKANRNSA